nr:DNA-directed DNA polymerase [Tanacetum cinerariifolium]
MRTRSNFYPSNSTANIPRSSNRRRIPNIVEPEIRTIAKIIPMADPTIEELPRAPTEGYGEAIVIPEIRTENFEIKMNLLWDVLNDAIKLMLFLYSLEDRARIWACPHHGFSELTQIDKFYNGLTEQDHDSLNAASGGNFLNKMTIEALQIIENKSKVRYSRSKSNVSRVNTNSRDVVSKTDDRIDKLADQIFDLVEIINKQVIAPAKAVEKTCVTCGGAHAYYECIATDSNPSSICAATGSYNQVSPPNRASHQIPTPGFALVQNNPNRFNQVPNNQIPPNVPNKFSSYIKSNEIAIKTMYNQINVLRGDFSKQEENLRRNLNDDMRNILSSFFQNQPSTSGTLPSNTIPNAKGEIKAVTTRSGLAYEGLSIPTESSLEKVDEQNTKEILDKEHFNSSGSTAQVQSPVVPISIPEPDVPRTQKKPTITCLAKVPLNENCSAMLLKKLPEKLRDLGKTNPTRMTLELADRSITHPKVVVKDVFVKVGKFHFPTDFVMVDFEADLRVPLILERSFLRTGHALIDVYGEEITLRVNDESITFNLNQTMRYSSTYDDTLVNSVDVIDVACEDFVQDVLDFQYNPKSSNPTLVSDDLISERYFQIPIDLQDQEKTTFTCPYGTFVYRRMPFGLCNAPGHKISKSGIEVDRAKVDVIAKLPHPTTVKGVRSFIGHAGSENLAADHLTRLENPHQDVLENGNGYDKNRTNPSKNGQNQAQNEKREKVNSRKSKKKRKLKIPACYDDDDDYAFVITPNEPVNSLSMGDEHLDTVPATKSDEFIKSSVENLVPIPSESEGESKCDVPAREEFTTFSNVLFVADYEFDSSDDQSLYDEDVPEKIFSNRLFEEEIILMKIDQHHNNAESDLVESLRTHDSSLIISSKIDSLLDEFAGELTLLKSILSGIDETDYDPEEDIRLIERLLYDNLSPRPSEEFVSDNSDTEIESFSPSPILVKDSDSRMEEINLSFNPDYPMPPGIEENDYDSERDILIYEELLDNHSLSLPENESFYFDTPSSYHPPTKPPDGNTGILNIKMMGDIFEQNIPMPRLMITRVSNQEKSPDLLSHQGLEILQPSAECPMMIHGKNTPILDVPLFHFYPLDQFKYEGN